MKFNNVENEMVVLPDGREVWLSRSIAVSGAIFAWRQDDEYPFVLISERGPGTPDFQGYENLVCGYLDKNETGTDAIIREVWEEVGLNLLNIINSDRDSIIHMEQPWFVNTDPNDSNRQNVTLRYGMCFLVGINEELPSLTTKYNAKVGEVVNPRWVKINEISELIFAFGHEKVINEYFDLITKHY